MKKIISSLALLVCLQAFAEDLSNSFKTSLATDALLLDIAITPESRVVIVGERGIILYSENGEDWTQANVPTRAMLTAVAFQDANVGWAVGYDATILETADGGKNWQLIQNNPNQEKPYLDIIPLKDEILIIGAYGIVTRSDDNGKTWSDDFFDQLLFEEDREFLDELRQESEEDYLIERGFLLPHFNRYIETSKGDFILGEAGFIGARIDGEWQRVEEFYRGSFLDGLETKEGKLIAVGLRGSIYTSSDGEEWEEVETDSTHSLSGIIQLSDGRIVAVGNSGSYVISDNDGESFSVHQTDDAKSIIAIAEHNGKVLIAAENGIHFLDLGEE